MTEFFAGLLVLCLGLAVPGMISMRHRASWLTVEESLDHPQRGPRYWYRFWCWCFWYALSLLLTAAAFGLMSDLAPMQALLQSLGVLKPVLLFIAAIPLALLGCWLDYRLTAWGSPRKRNARRKLGLPGWQVPPRPNPGARLHVAFATSLPPLPGNVSAAEPALDPGDPELVRELARKHWDAINFAIASNGDVAGVHARQSAFLDGLDERLDGEDAARVRAIYSQESVAHARTMASVSARRDALLLEQATLRSRVHRNLKILGWILGALFLLNLLIRAIE